MNYHISRQGQTYGPYPAEDVKRMLNEGRLLPTDLCWTEGMAGWEPLGQVMGAAATPPTPAPPPPQRPVQPPAGQPAPQAYAARPAQPAQPAPGWQAQPAQAAWSGGGQWPAPPDMHWAAVMLLTFVTCGIFGLVWFYKQAAFVKRLDPKNQSIQFFFGYLAVLFVSLAISFMGRLTTLMILNFLLPWASFALVLAAVFSVRNALQRHYNTVENIGLRLNPVMTFFFSILYFQYHLSRIARWKRTGQLV
jgi:hypothetical protein